MRSLRTLVVVPLIWLWGCTSMPSQEIAVTEWEHGYRTNRVVATRYKSPTMGYNIGFRFPRDSYHADRAELFDFMQKYDGYVYQGGGAPGAELFTVFKGVKDRKSANALLVRILPELHKLIVKLAGGE